MEKSVLSAHDLEEEEEVPGEFQCCICLEVLYKPVVVACGHMACFWCIFRAMDNSLRASHCPVCRHPYNHFPRICKLLHSLLSKLYPTIYATREHQISEDEEKSGMMSQQFDNLESETSASTGVLESKDCTPEEIQATVIAASSSETKTDAVPQTNTDGSNKKLTVTDLTCGVCRQLLYRPVVLNCGDVCCEACISQSSDTIFKCSVCQSMHPGGFPKMCWVLEHFLEEEFPEQYAARKEWYSKENNDQLRSSAGKLSSHGSDKTPVDALPSLSRRGPKIHFLVGCDYCGMYPIFGERYRCKDCKESMGFDLCEECYDRSGKLPGRFNQQHTEDHEFEKMDPVFHHIWERFGTVSISGNLDYRSTLLRVGSVHPEEIGSNDLQEHEDGSLSPEDVGDSPESPIIILDDNDDDDDDEEGVDS